MSSKSPRRAAFSLIEILSVISIMSVLLLTTAPFLTSLLGAAGTDRAVDEISSLLDHARLSAIQTGTWVWVGIADTTPAGGPRRLSVVEVASRDGSATLSDENLSALSSPVSMLKVAGSCRVDGLSDDASGDFRFSWTVPSDTGPRQVSFAGMVLGFSPSGEVTTRAGQVPTWIRLTLSPTGKASEGVSLLVSGPSGQTIVSH